jgi:hypothetical protein
MVVNSFKYDIKENIGVLVALLLFLPKRGLKAKPYP